MAKRTTRTVFTLRIEMDNDAFTGGAERPELARVLREISYAVDSSAHTGKARDFSGNTVGEWIIAEHPIRRGGR